MHSIIYLAILFVAKVIDNAINTTDAATSISGKELGIHLGLPRATIAGLPVIEHAEFGKEVNSYRLFRKDNQDNPEDRMTLGKVFDLGQITNKVVDLTMTIRRNV